jgi:hypothetical protein
MSIPDSVAATVEVVYSNIGEEWIAGLYDENGKAIVEVTGMTRAGALANLVDEIE